VEDLDQKEKVGNEALLNSYKLKKPIRVSQAMMWTTHMARTNLILMMVCTQSPLPNWKLGLLVIKSINSS
jgi:hypothetical protein